MKKPATWGYRMLAPILLPVFLFYYRPKIFGKGNIPRKGAVVICSNHKHVFDQCLVVPATHRAVNYMAKSEYFKGKFAWFFKLAGCICVNRNGHDEEAKALANAVLSNGGALGIFHREHLLVLCTSMVTDHTTIVNNNLTKNVK